MSMVYSDSGAQGRFFIVYRTASIYIMTIVHYTGLVVTR